MRFSCRVARIGKDHWRVSHTGAGMGTVHVIAHSRDEALEKMRNELRYRLEISPCCGEAYKDVPIELVEEEHAK